MERQLQEHVLDEVAAEHGVVKSAAAANTRTANTAPDNTICCQCQNPPPQRAKTTAAVQTADAVADQQAKIEALQTAIAALEAEIGRLRQAAEETERRAESAAREARRAEGERLRKESWETRFAVLPALVGALRKVRKTPSWPRSWANSSLF
jgi:septal ring factor EnvC (AmiA/AmiB activator)